MPAKILIILARVLIFGGCLLTAKLLLRSVPGYTEKIPDLYPDDNSYILPSNDEESSDKAISEIIQIHEIRNPEPAAQTSAPHAIQHNHKQKFEMENGEKCTKNYKYDESTTG
ncbi:hypothetical protein C1646_747183 [Rhizophagus diaphanus]|nr:hypothetical protein C1646_747183 [Rhizophagus diaphanus] [Rhizophagus sp. MUCL 43196]